MLHQNQYFSLRTSLKQMITFFVIFVCVSQSTLNAQVQSGNLEFEGRSRNYLVYLPANYARSANFPLVIHLHSGGWTAQQDMDYIKLNRVADTFGFIVVYPNAISRWNVGIGGNSGGVDDVGFIDALIDRMDSSYGIDLTRVYACGYSRGGIMAYKLALYLSHRIAAIACVSGTIETGTPEVLNPINPMPVLHIHGTSDTWVPINGRTDRLSVDQVLSLWTGFNDCVQADTTLLPDLDSTDGCTVERTTYTDCSDNCNVVYYKVINGGHTWPGAGPPGYSAGLTNQDIDANMEIWHFFENHQLVPRPVVDFNGDGYVDIKDLLRLIQSWGQDDPSVDIAPSFGDGVVDGADLEVLMSHWAQEVYDPHLLAHWKLDESEGDVAYDSAAENDAIVMGGPIWMPTAGYVGGALQFDGLDDCILADSVLAPDKGPFSIFAWIKGGAPDQVILSQEGGADWLLTDAQGHLMTGLEGGGRRSGGPLISETVITDDKWHRIGFTWDGSGRSLYVNDTMVAEDSQPNLLGSSSSGGLYIGVGKDFQPGTFWSGMIDDVRVYDRVIIP